MNHHRDPANFATGWCAKKFLLKWVSIPGPNGPASRQPPIRQTNKQSHVRYWGEKLLLSNSSIRQEVQSVSLKLLLSPTLPLFLQLNKRTTHIWTHKTFILKKQTKITCYCLYSPYGSCAFTHRVNHLTHSVRKIIMVTHSLCSSCSSCCFFITLCRRVRTNQADKHVYRSGQHGTCKKKTLFAV